MTDFVCAQLQDGSAVLAIPFVRTKEYLSAPRHWRWLTYVGAASLVRRIIEL